MKIGRCLLILAIFLLIATSLSANDNDPYALPPSKAFVETCNREALILHPGAIDKERNCIGTEIIGWNMRFRRVTVLSGW
jgi:hypothetical protein